MPSSLVSSIFKGVFSLFFPAQLSGAKNPKGHRWVAAGDGRPTV
jgi:hypothetical protein